MVISIDVPLSVGPKPRGTGVLLKEFMSTDHFEMRHLEIGVSVILKEL